MSGSIPIERNIKEKNLKNSTSKWVIFLFLLAVYSIVFFFLMSTDRFPELKEFHLWIKLLIYVFALAILFGPFLPVKKSGGKRVSIVSSLVRMIEGPKKRKIKAKPESKLNVEYRPPLIHLCKCGFLLTRQMEKCPNCQRLNEFFTKD